MFYIYLSSIADDGSQGSNLEVFHPFPEGGYGEFPRFVGVGRGLIVDHGGHRVPCLESATLNARYRSLICFVNKVCCSWLSISISWLNILYVLTTPFRVLGAYGVGLFCILNFCNKGRSPYNGRLSDFSFYIDSQISSPEV